MITLYAATNRVQMNQRIKNVTRIEYTVQDIQYDSTFIFSVEP